MSSTLDTPLESRHEPALSDASSTPSPPQRERPPRTVFHIALGALALTSLFLVGYLPRERARAALVVEAAKSSNEPASVHTIKPTPSKPERTLVLPGTLRSFEQTLLLARANGYVQRWLVDLGEHVEAGQLLAELDTPELDREVEQARANLLERKAAVSEARAAHDFALVNHQRFGALVPAGVAPKSELERSRAEAQMAEAKVAVAEAARASGLANLNRLEQLKSFARVTAPFAGTITARKVDRGALVTAGSSVLFELAVFEPLRAIADVPQHLALALDKGAKGSLAVREHPGRSFPIEVVRSAGALDTRTRTLRIELQVPNEERLLLPGMYAEISLTVAHPAPSLSVPASAVIASKDGLRVATVDDSGVVHLKPVTVERDNGNALEIATGLSPGDTLLGNPSPTIADGTRVRVVQQKP